MKTLQKDLTTGNPGKIIFNFTLPIFIGNVFQQFYSMADTIIVGKFVGTKALAAVGSTGTIMFLINGFILGMTAGFTVLTAQKFGAGDMKAMRKTVGNAAILAIIMSLIMTVLGMMAMKPLLGIMKTPDDIFKDAYAYIMVICGGIAAQMLYNFLSSVLRALGNSKVPLYFLILAALLNIVLDMVFIIAFHMGAAGAAIATVIAQCVNFLLLLLASKQLAFLRAKEVPHKAERLHWSRYLSVLLPLLFCEASWSLGENVYAAIYGRMGTAESAAMTLTAPIQGLVIGALCGLSQAAGVIVGKRLGGEDYDEAYQAAKRLMVYGAVGAAVLCTVVLLTSGAYVEIYRVSPTVKLMTRQILSVYAMAAPFKVLNMILGGGILRSGGRTAYVMGIDMLGTWAFGVPLGLLGAFVWRLPIAYVYLLLSLEGCVRFAISMAVFRRKRWMRRLDG